MRKALSWSDIDRDIDTQPKVKLPDRRFLNLWNGYDPSQFRAAEEDWRDWEAPKDQVTKRQLETRQAARGTDSTRSTWALSPKPCPRPSRESG